MADISAADLLAKVPGKLFIAGAWVDGEQGATTIDMPLEDYLRRLRASGLGTLPGTAAEVLDDEVRKILCPDKINTAQWFEVMRTAHRVGKIASVLSPSCCSADGSPPESISTGESPAASVRVQVTALLTSCSIFLASSASGT